MQVLTWLLCGAVLLAAALLWRMAVLRTRSERLRLADGAASQAACRRLTDDKARAEQRIAELEATVEAERTTADAARRERDEATAAMKMRDEFMALLGHELRNPLAPIQTALELMRARPEMPHERERGVIERQTRHLLRLVDDMLDMARITRGKIELRRERVELADLIAKSIEIAGPSIEQRGHQLVTEVEHGMVVDGDSARLIQVFANLIGNAAKYTDARGQIRIRVTRDAGHAVVAVRDNGRGIDAEALPHVFEMFVQERGRGGLGLGLAIVHSLVELHGGTVTAASDGPGTGSEFAVRLPLAESVRLAIPASEPHAEAGAVLPIVMVVDDNEDAADLLADLLRARGCEVHVARDSSDALDQAARVVPDVAVLDIGLPDGDGYELARRLRALPSWRDVRLIALTGYGAADDRKRSSEAGFACHLVKPVDAARIVQLVHDGDRVPEVIN